MKVILDASVAIKWFFNEINSENAEKILYQIKNEEIKVIVPTLFFYEIGNVMLSKKQTAEYIGKTFNIINNLNFKIENIESKSFLNIYQNAQKYPITFYDSTYVTLMKEKNCKFVTADKKLYQKIKNDFPLAQLI